MLGQGSIKGINMLLLLLERMFVKLLLQSNLIVNEQACQLFQHRSSEAIHDQ